MKTYEKRGASPIKLGGVALGEGRFTKKNRINARTSSNCGHAGTTANEGGTVNLDLNVVRPQLRARAASIIGGVLWGKGTEIVVGSGVSLSASCKANPKGVGC
jgi:hypothetical protein